MFKFDENELTKEKSLWDIYLGAKHIKLSRFNLTVYSIAFLFLIIDCLFISTEYHQLLEEAREWALFGFDFSISVLGFLIAGFTIFATLGKPDMFLKMMDHKDSESGLPFLKYNFFCFMRVFIYYIACLLFYLTIILLFKKNGVASYVVRFLPHANYVAFIGTKIVYILVGWSFVFLTLQLKTFIFNIYSAVMNSLRWELHDRRNP